MPYGTGSCTYHTCIAKVAFLSIFQFFYDLHDLPQKKKLHALTAKKNNSIFLIIYTTYRKKKLHAFTAKKITRLDGFFVHNLRFSPVQRSAKRPMHLLTETFDGTQQLRFFSGGGGNMRDCSNFCFKAPLPPLQPREETGIDPPMYVVGRVIVFCHDCEYTVMALVSPAKSIKLAFIVKRNIAQNTIFCGSHVYNKRKMHEIQFFCTHVTAKKSTCADNEKITRVYSKINFTLWLNISHLGDLDSIGHVAGWSFSPHWGPQDGRGYMATFDLVPTVGTPKTVGVMQPFCPHVGPQDGRGYVAISDVVPTLGTHKMVRVM